MLPAWNVTTSCDGTWKKNGAQLAPDMEARLRAVATGISNTRRITNPNSLYTNPCGYSFYLDNQICVVSGNCLLVRVVLFVKCAICSLTIRFHFFVRIALHLLVWHCVLAANAFEARFDMVNVPQSRTARQSLGTFALCSYTSSPLPGRSPLNFRADELRADAAWSPRKVSELLEG